MSKSSIEKTVEINATPKNLWRAFTDPVLTRQMGGEYVTDWKVGSSFSWKSIDGNIYSNGTITQIEPESILQHNLFNLDDTTSILSVITYMFKDNGTTTTLYAREDLPVELTEEDFENASEGWDFALQTLKQMAESLK
ncbi:MAG: SRPBCC domain-containing protein [Ferruginibacter sp.]